MLKYRNKQHQTYLVKLKLGIANMLGRNDNTNGLFSFLKAYQHSTT